MLCRRYWSILLTFAMTLLAGTARSKGEIRCYCNLPVCVPTGYMCKSSLGVCSSEAAGAARSDPGKTRHGCAELMGQPRRDACLQRAFLDGVEPFSSSASGAVDKFPNLECCREDMCNYPDSVDIRIRINARVNHSQHASAVAGVPSSIEESEIIFSGSPREGATKRDLWFKAAVIAVPIAGGFILVLLILVAIHMLRRDHRHHHRQAVELRQQYKAHLLIDEDHLHPPRLHPHVHVHGQHHHHQHHRHSHHENKNEAHAKLNKMAAAAASSSSSSDKPNNNSVYRNINVAISHDGSATGGSRPNHDRCADGPLGKSFCGAVVVSWNDSSECKPSTRV